MHAQSVCDLTEGASVYSVAVIALAIVIRDGVSRGPNGICVFVLFRVAPGWLVNK